MTDLIKTYPKTNWQENFSSHEQEEAITALETGQILFFPALGFVIEDEEKIFLSPHYANPKTKNISYNAELNRVRGAKVNPEEYSLLRNMLDRYATYSTQLITALFPQYRNKVVLGRTSFRPIEINNRTSSYRKDDTRLHVDAFPATPNHGQRLLRVFCNINPQGQARVWRIGEPFEEVARKFLPKTSKPLPMVASLLHLLKLTKSLRSDYDHIMLQIHNRMKYDLDYQHTVTQSEINFLPGSSWIVQTDQVSHAAMAGQFLLEQTFYLPVHAMRDPTQAPLKVLERLTGRALVRESEAIT
jgi:hypothetical protein